MRRAMILMAVAALMVALMAGTAAAKQNGKNRVTYNFRGTLQEVAADGSYVVVDVSDGNKRARGHLGVQQFGVTTDTKIEVNGQKADLSALVVGEQVKVQSKAAKDAQQFGARKISVEFETEEEAASDL
jgi:type 1 fimbria pilin